MLQAVRVPYAIRDEGCLNKNGAVTNGHSSPCEGDCLPRVFAVVFLYLRRGEQEYLLLNGGQCQYVQGRCLGHLYGTADAPVAHLQTGECAAVAVMTAVLAAKGSVVVYSVAGVVQYMLDAGVAAVATAVSDGIHARPRPYEAYYQHYGYVICPPLFHFGGKGTAFFAHLQVPKNGERAICG